MDTLCNGVATPETPADARITIYIPTTKPVIDGFDPEWFSGFLTASHRYSAGSGSLDIGKEPCTRPGAL